MQLVQLLQPGQHHYQQQYQFQLQQQQQEQQQSHHALLTPSFTSPHPSIGSIHNNYSGFDICNNNRIINSETQYHLSWDGRSEVLLNPPLLTSTPQIKMEIENQLIKGENSNNSQPSNNNTNNNSRGHFEVILPDFVNEHSRSNSPQINDDGSGGGDKSNSQKLVDPKVCGVCGDKALGNNFNAITCESCKAFFRRNALKTKEFICPFNSNCKVDPVTRRFCQKCRLKKCFDIGMKKEWIMTDEEKKMKKSKIEQNRLKRQSSDTLPMNSSSSSSSSVLNTPLRKIPCLSTNENSNPSTPGAGSVAMVCSPIPSASNISIYPPNMQTPSPPDPTLPYTKGSKMAVTPTGRPQYQSESMTLNYGDGNGSNDQEGLMAEFFVSGQSKKSLSSNTTNKAQLSQTVMDHQGRQIGVINQAQRKYAQDSEQEQQHQQQLIWCSGESSSSSSSSIPFPSTYETVRSQQSPSSVIPVVQSNLVTYDHQQQLEGQQNRSGGSYKLLTSLIRPGITESPPDANLLDCSTSNINPKTTEDYSENRQILEKRQMDDESSSSEEPQVVQTHSHSQHQTFPASLVDDETSLQPLPLNTMDSILSVAIKAEFNAFGMMGGPHCGLQSSRELNNAERAKLNELLLASEALNAPVDAEGPIKVSEGTDHSLINVINLTDIAIRRLIKMSKKISGFKNMCQEDQIALLKGSCTEMMILRSVVTYDPDRDTWNIPHSNVGYNIKLGVLKEARGNLYEEHQRFAKSFKSSWRLDENIMIILCAITLFTAERPNVIHKDVVKLEQDSYYYLLKRYLESIVSGCEARSTYLQLIGKIAELHNLNSNHLRVFLEVNPREVEPLLIEIFDLK